MLSVSPTPITTFESDPIGNDDIASGDEPYILMYLSELFEEAIQTIVLFHRSIPVPIIATL